MPIPLRVQESEQEVILRGIADGIGLYAPDGHLTYANKALAHMLGFPSPEALLATPTQDMISRFDLFDETGQPLSPEQLPGTQVLRGESEAEALVQWRRRETGERRWALIKATPILDEQKQLQHVVNIFHDVTVRRDLEERFRQTMKMEAMGRLAGGVAHDFNNLLTVITGYGQIVQSTMSPGDPMRDLVLEIITAGNRAAGLTRQLLAFSRKETLEPRVLDLKTEVAGMEKLLRRMIGEDIELVTVADSDLGKVKADPGHIEQVILNLAVNARDAMPRGGKLTIEVCNIELDGAVAWAYPDARPGPYVLLTMTDTGVGMDAATRSRLFEPFFTTKGDKGTGLGLATVWGAVKQSGGSISVCSELGQGTCFKVFLPRVQETVPAPTQPGLTIMPQGCETVLLAEDEDGVRSLTRDVLKVCGYTVLEAHDGVEALRLAGCHQGRLDLLITDVVMPRLCGPEVAEQLTRLYPNIRVLFLSGYTDEAVIRHGVLEAEVPFLQKPFSPAALATKVRDLLDQPQARTRDALSSSLFLDR